MPREGTFVLARLRWGSVVLAGASLAIGLYLFAAGAVFAIVRFHRGVQGARLVDAVVPSRWPQFRAAQGNHLIGVAMQLVQRGKRREALSHARAGVAQSPAHRSGRLLLARLLIEANRPDTAQQVLLDGVPYHAADPRYLEPVFSFLLQRHEDAQVIALARRLLPAAPAPLPQHRLAALAGATASFFRGNCDLAEDFLRCVPQLETSRDGRLFSARLEWERGYRELALLRLRALADTQARDAEIQGELVSRLRQAGYADEARRRSLALQIAEPGLAAPRIALLHLAADAQDTAGIEREANAVLADFTDAPTLLALSEFAANIGDAALAQRIVVRATALGLPAEPHAILRIEALLTAREYRAVLEAIRVFRAANIRPGPFEPILDSLQAVAHLGLGDPETARVFIANLLDQRSLRSASLLALANRCVELGAADSARKLLARAISVDPLNQPALSRLVELDLGLNRVDELPAHVQRLLTLRQPSPDLLRVVQHKLGSDLFLFSPGSTAALDTLRVALDSPSGRLRL